MTEGPGGITKTRRRTKRPAVTMAVPAKVRLRVTPADFWRLCLANSELRLTRTSQGELIVMAPAGTESGARNSDLNGQLWAWNRASMLGVTFDSSSGFKLPDGFTHSPDAAWLERSRWEALTRAQREKFAPICPDFVAELMSPSDSRLKTRSMVRAFMDHGARLGWLLDVHEREVEIHRPGLPLEVLKNPTTLSGEDVLPGFVLDLNGILFD